MIRSFAALCIAVLAGRGAAAAPPAPLIDYHQHLVSPAFARIVQLPEFDGAALVRRLDAAGVRKAVVLSTAYSMADDRKHLPDPDRLTTAENDWTAAQVAGAAGRLIGFCSANPLRDAALAELRRCLALPGMRGIKLHFGNSGVSLRDPAHLARMNALFAFAGTARVPVLIHMRARGGDNYGAPDARILIARLLPLAPHSDVIVAHLGGAGGYPEQNDEVMGAFAEAAARHDPRVRRLYFDLATVVTAATTPAEGREIALRIRQVGPRHILYGSDLLVSPLVPSIAEAWHAISTKLGLTPAELRTIAGNRLAFVG